MEFDKNIFSLVTSVLFVDLVILIFVKRQPWKPINDWYNRFGVESGVTTDVLSIVIGFFIAEYIYEYFELSDRIPFAIVLVLVQLVHDLLFFLYGIKPTPNHTNDMIDQFKAYSVGGATILAVDAGMMLGSYAVYNFMVNNMDDRAKIFFFITVLYILQYVLFQRNQYTTAPKVDLTEYNENFKKIE